MADHGLARGGTFEEGTHFGPLGTFALTTLVSAGPWLATWLAVAARDALWLFGSATPGDRLFLCLVTTACAFSLVLMAPWQLVATRLLTDKLSEGREADAVADFWRLLPVALLVQLVLGVGFLAFVPLSSVLRGEALVLYLLNSSIWLALVYLSALRNYKTLAWAFGPGLVIGVLAAWSGELLDPAFQLGGFTLGAAVSFWMLLRGMTRTLDAPGVGERSLIALWRYRWLAVAGLCYATGLWIDKWLFWNHAGTAWVIAGPLQVSPVYDDAMFIAALTALPGLALFLLKAEPAFNLQYRAYLRTFAVSDPAAGGQARTRMLRTLREGLSWVLGVQGAFTLLVALFAPEISRMLGLHWFSLPVFRAGVLAAGLQVFAGIGLTLLLYFDWQRTAALLAACFASLNGLATWLSLHIGLMAYGYGTLFASAAAVALAFGLLEHGLARLESRLSRRPLPALAHRAGIVAIALYVLSCPAHHAGTSASATLQGPSGPIYWEVCC
ncbi:MAG TPA: exopolysaccharide Pel transporter PelG [Oscillatoriaceae cyanobacterium]